MRLTRVVPAVTLVALALSGCTLAAPGSLQPSETSRPEQRTVTIDAAAVLDELGPVPPDPELTDELLEDYRVRWLDWQWEGVRRSFPDAQRPEVAEIERATGTNPRSQVCTDEARAAGLDEQAFAIAVYTCSVEYPVLPNGTLSHDQAGYLYDYLTRFVMPCFAAAGYSDEGTPPSREFFAANWPFQNWSPQPARDGSLAGGHDLDTVRANCPSIPEGLQR